MSANRVDPELDDTVRDFSRALLRKASQLAGVVQDEKVRSAEGVGVYGNYVSKSRPTSVLHVVCPTSHVLDK